MTVASRLVDRVRRIAALMPAPAPRPQIRAGDLVPGLDVRYCGDEYTVVDVAHFTDTVLVTIVSETNCYTIEYHVDELVDTP